ncbi:hypothetical protein EJ08DRAFT_238900 [Tothia fuscella]|uniref:tRNA(Ile)-lysidine synthetase n=1 Tax=Tothia fuscella TaxID=1048955 RepID=A0A9P4NRX6_9PEZI|nr:hypothetical protein EJ08DRAFT_238900 [Tothia fuscella]
MFRKSLRLSQSAQYIKQDEFLEALGRMWSSKRDTQPLPKKYSLAISGGVDSMALAVLCKEYIYPNAQLDAFVVDHKFRKTSTEEARIIQKTLEGALDIPTKILTLSLKDANMTTSNMETTARRLRYQALGHECRELRSRILLLGHHQDDQYESIIQRLSTSHTTGLRVMQALSNMPDCFGLYGIHQSGDPKPVSRTQYSLTGVHAIESGSIQIGRPLLQFPKERLMATCEKYDIPWIEDQSNKDVKLTSRNSIRHILQHHKFPSALSKERLLALSASKQAQSEALTSSVNRSMGQTKLALDIRTGTLTAVIPQTKLENTNVKIAVLHRLATLVSPLPLIEVSQFAGVGKSTSRLPFTAGDVYFQPVYSGTEQSEPTHWLLQRAPYKSQEAQKPHITMVFHPNNNPSPSPAWTNFRLWDNRFWIRIFNSSPKTINIRPLLPNDITTLRTLLKNKQLKIYSTTPSKDQYRLKYTQHPPSFLKEALETVAKGPIRFTLLAIAISDEQTGESNVCALPTLGLRFGDGAGWGKAFQGLQWEVRYKEVDLVGGDLRHCLN